MLLRGVRGFDPPLSPLGKGGLSTLLIVEN